uniref:Derlin n=1 Tax=Canis lupus familiaris TaxID=9615 RepID=A0A8I3N688_CANLF
VLNKHPSNERAKEELRTLLSSSPFQTPSEKTQRGYNPGLNCAAGVQARDWLEYLPLPLATTVSHQSCLSAPAWPRPFRSRPRAAAVRPRGENLRLPFKRRDFWSTSSTAAGRGSFAFERSLARPNSVAPRPPFSAFLAAAWAASASTPSTRGAGPVVRGRVRGVGRLCAPWPLKRRRCRTSGTGSGASRPSRAIGSPPLSRCPWSANSVSSARPTSSSGPKPSSIASRFGGQSLPPFISLWVQELDFFIWSIYISYISILHDLKQLLMIPLIMSVLYVWAQLNRDMIVSFWFGTRFKACYLPWVILGFNYIIGGSYRWLPSRRGGVSGFGVPPASMRRAADQNGGGGRHNWGQGFRLGDQ